MKKSKFCRLTAWVSALLILSVLCSCGDSGAATTGTPAGSAVPGGTTAPEPAVTTAGTAGTPDPSAPAAEGDGWVSAVFGGGPFVTKLDSSRYKTLEKLRTSGFNTAIVWSVHVHDDGSLWLNDVKVCDDGKVVASSRITKYWNQIKGEGSSVTRVELSVGAWGCKDFEAIGAMMKRDGRGSDTELYKNFKALIDAYDADAVDFDDETCYDPQILTDFGRMCVDMGVKVTLCPYTMTDVWKKVKDNLGDAVDRIYVQCYAGGAGNYGQLASWKNAFGMDVIPGLYNTESTGNTAAAMGSYLKKNSGYVTGGFMWLWDEMENTGSPNSVADYGKAINNQNKFAK